LVGIVVVSHSARVADGVVELAREMAGPYVRLTAVGGILQSDGSFALGTEVERIREAIEQVDTGDGVVVFADLGGAILSAEMAVEALPDAGRDRVVISDAPLVEGALAAAVRARAGGTPGDVAAEARQALRPKIEHLSSPVSTASTEENDDAGFDRAQFLVTNPSGLHARPAARLIRAAADFAGAIQIANVTAGTSWTDGRSLIGILSLAVRQGDEVAVRARGPGSVDLLHAIAALASSGFGEGADPAFPERPESSALNLIADDTVLTGNSAVPGVVEGPAFWLADATPISDEATGEPDVEWATLREAIERAEAEFAAGRVAPAGDAETILQAQRLLLQDDALVGAARRAIEQHRVTAGAAWRRAVKSAVRALKSTGDSLIQERAIDVEDVGRIVERYIQRGASPEAMPEQPSVILADELQPSVVAAWDRQVVVGVAAMRGAPTSHAAVLLRSAGIPTVVGIGPTLRSVTSGTRVVVDGARGWLVVNPTKTPLAESEFPSSQMVPAESGTSSATAEPARTRDGRAIEVHANVGSLAEARMASRNGANGIGLVRTEFLFVDRANPPSEDEQVAAYRSIVKAMAGRPVTIRTLDAGGDKPLRFIPRSADANPALGLRGLRLSLAEPDFFRVQLRAILRSAADGPVGVMFPMVSTIGEVRAARALLRQAADELRARNVTVPRLVGIGVMVEVPAAVDVVERFAPEIDFVSIGTNDLAQYTMAADRDNSTVGTLADALQPAVLSQIRSVVAVGRASGLPVAICGEVAGDLAALPLLVGLGLTRLSVRPSDVIAVKRAIGGIGDAEASEEVGLVASAEDAAAVRRILAQRALGGTGSAR
jgi:phosphocarrier protein FPr